MSDDDENISVITEESTQKRKQYGCSEATGLEVLNRKNLPMQAV